MKFGIGQSAARIEDRQLLVGAGCFSDDVAPGQGLRIAFLRAPYAHARMRTLDVSAARKLAGVRLVATQADLDADNIGDIECQFCPPLIGGAKCSLSASLLWCAISSVMLVKLLPWLWLIPRT